MVARRRRWTVRIDHRGRRIDELEQAAARRGRRGLQLERVGEWRDDLEAGDGHQGEHGQGHARELARRHEVDANGQDRHAGQCRQPGRHRGRHGSTIRETPLQSVHLGGQRQGLRAMHVGATQGAELGDALDLIDEVCREAGPAIARIAAASCERQRRAAGSATPVTTRNTSSTSPIAGLKAPSARQVAAVTATATSGGTMTRT